MMSRNHEFYAATGLSEMLNQNGSAKAYFMSLPDYVQGMLQQRAQNIHTEDELRRYAENILQGDK